LSFACIRRREFGEPLRENAPRAVLCLAEETANVKTQQGRSALAGKISESTFVAALNALRNRFTERTNSGCGSGEDIDFNLGSDRERSDAEIL
jgi:hypothetical protein